VFASPQGAVLRVANFRRGHLDRAAKEVGVAGLVPHGLRHTAASLAISAGASVKSVQRMLGHASATLTLGRYGHLFPDELDTVAVRLDEAVPSADVYRTCTPSDPSLFKTPGEEIEELFDLRFCWVPPAGFEPATHGLGNRRSIP
jgi:hypothetical protein